MYASSYRQITYNSYRVLLCGYSREQAGEDRCSRETIPEETLNRLVWKSIQQIFEVVGDLKTPLELKKKDKEKQLSKQELLIKELREEIYRYDREQKRNVELLITSGIDREEFLQKKSKLEEHKKSFGERLREMEECVRTEKQEEKEIEEAVDDVDRFAGSSELTREMVEAFVDKVIVYDPGNIVIKWNFSDKVLKELEELKGEGDPVCKESKMLEVPDDDKSRTERKIGR